MREMWIDCISCGTFFEAEMRGRCPRCSSMYRLQLERIERGTIYFKAYWVMYFTPGYDSLGVTATPIEVNAE